jgi:hypothetical protein
MAQTTRPTGKSSTNRSRARSSNSSKRAASKRSSSNRSNSSGNRATTKTAARPRSQSRSTAQSQNGAGSIKDTAIDKTKAAGHSVAEAAARAKTPLIAGGTALIGVAAGAVVKDRLATDRSKRPLKRLRRASALKPVTKLDFSQLDLDTVKSAADRVSAYGQQASDIAAAVEKTRKKNK